MHCFHLQESEDSGWRFCLKQQGRSRVVQIVRLSVPRNFDIQISPHSAHILARGNRFQRFLILNANQIIGLIESSPCGPIKTLPNSAFDQSTDTGDRFRKLVDNLNLILAILLGGRLPVATMNPLHFPSVVQGHGEQAQVRMVVRP
jgi:hypothetical protein